MSPLILGMFPLVKGVVDVLKSVEEKQAKYVKAGENETVAYYQAWHDTLLTQPIDLIDEIFDPTTYSGKFAKWAAKKYFNKNLDKFLTQKTLQEIKLGQVSSYWNADVSSIVVKPGDSIWKIAKDYKTTVKGLADNSHQSFLKTKEFTIDLGYRLKIFGYNNRTEQETINITRNAS